MQRTSSMRRGATDAPEARRTAMKRILFPVSGAIMLAGALLGSALTAGGAHAAPCSPDIRLQYDQEVTCINFRYVGSIDPTILVTYPDSGPID